LVFERLAGVEDFPFTTVEREEPASPAAADSEPAPALPQEITAAEWRGPVATEKARRRYLP
jgi:hypothetical protein